MTAHASEKRKLPRFHITPSQFHDEKLNKNFSVQDLSQGGISIRLVHREDTPEFAVATVHQGILKIEGLKLPCKFQVRWIRGSHIGGEWIEMDPLLRKQLEQISQPKFLASGLKRFEIPDEQDTVWYHNPLGVDLLVYPKDRKIGRWILYIHQNFILWEQESIVKTGKAMAEDEDGYSHGVVRLETRLLKYNEHPDQRLIETAAELIKHAQLLDEDLRETIQNHLKASF